MREPPQQRVATPKVKEGTDGAPFHVTNWPKRPSALQVRATATQRNRRHHGVEVRRTITYMGRAPLY